MPESEQPTAGDQSAKRDTTARLTSRNNITSRTDMYRVAYQESQRTLGDQHDELKDMRDRAVSFMAFIGAATAFLVGSGLQAGKRDTLFYTLAIIASVLSAASIVLLLVLLTPSKKNLWHYRLSAESMIKGWIEADVPPPNDASFIRALAIKYDEMHQKNEVLLASLRKSYRWLITLGAAQITVWAALVWIKR